MRRRTAVVTGATGMIGAGICRALADAGWEIRRMTRGRAGGDTSYAFEMPDRLDEAALDGPVGAVVHCALAEGPPGRARAANLAGTRRLLAAARRARAGRFIFLSSLSAHPAAASHYARSKREIESWLDPARDLIVRPGLVIGPGGLFGRMRAAVRAGWPVPIVQGGGQPVHPVWIGDLCAAVTALIEEEAAGAVAVGALEPVTIRRVIDRLTAIEGRSARTFQIPAVPAQALLRWIEAIGLALPLSSDTVAALSSLRAFDLSADLARLKTPIRPFDAAIEALLEGEARR